MITQPSRGWFGSKWLNQTIHFATDPPCSWRTVQKLQEQETIFVQDDYRSSHLYSESIGIFICEKIGSSTPAIMKIRMQVPNSIDDPSSSQTYIQPPEKICGRTLQEIEALIALTKAECPCTPKYFASKHTNQNSEGWVPGGFPDYIVMEKLEGVTLSEEYLGGLSQQEQQELRNMFKSSYLECQERGFYHLNASLSNLIWNKQKMTCYIIDWEAWIQKAYPWDDDEYLNWGLV